MYAIISHIKYALLVLEDMQQARCHCTKVLQFCNISMSLEAESLLVEALKQEMHHTFVNQDNTLS